MKPEWQDVDPLQGDTARRTDGAVVNWRVKALVQKIRRPAARRRTAFTMSFSGRFGLLKNFERELDGKVDDWRIMVGHLQAAGLSIGGSSLLEIGSGWYPTFPMALFLAGGTKIVTVDLNRHLKSELTLAAAARLGSHLETIATASGRRVGRRANAAPRAGRKAEQRVQHRRRERRHHRLPGAD